MTRIIGRSLIIFAILLAVSLQGEAQDGGVSNIFSKGVGARQMGLAGAVVAFPQDATSIFWNPAGMEEIPMKGVTLFYTNFLEGTSYNFIGYVHPTLNMGTFGMGLSRVAIAGIPRTEHSIEKIGEFGFEQDEFYLSYAKFVRNQLSVGVNLKLERQILDDLSDVGFGVDVGAFYKIEGEGLLLNGTQIGLTIHNAYSPRLNPGDNTDYIPHKIWFGVAQPISMGMTSNPLFLLFAVEQGDQEELRYHSGIEYAYQNLGMLRLGMSSDGLTFGVGARLQKIQMDYAYQQLARGEFGSGHRISLTFNFGKTRQELYELVQARRQQEIRDRVAREQEQQRRELIGRLLSEGKQLYENGQYYEARVKYSQVLDLDPGNPEADEMLTECDNRLKEQREREMKESLAKIQELSERQRTEEFVNKHLSKGDNLLSKGDYLQAIQEYQLALDRLPDNAMIKEKIDKAKKELTTKIEELINSADDFAQKGDINTAIDFLKQAEVLSRNDLVTQDEIQKRISKLETKLNVFDYYQTGLINYRAKNWSEARKNFEKAMKLDPGNAEIAKFYREAERRENAREEPMPPDVRRRFQEGLQLYVNDKLEEAIKIFQELLELQPYNKYIIDAIDKAAAELEKRQRIKK